MSIPEVDRALVAAVSKARWRSERGVTREGDDMARFAWRCLVTRDSRGSFYAVMERIEVSGGRSAKGNQCPGSDANMRYV
jgi:hypothetical protein